MKASSMLGALLPLNEMDKDFAPIEPPFLSGECENKEGNTKFSVSYQGWEANDHGDGVGNDGGRRQAYF